MVPTDPLSTSLGRLRFDDRTGGVVCGELNDTITLRVSSRSNVSAAGKAHLHPCCAGESQSGPDYSGVEDISGHLIGCCDEKRSVHHVSGPCTVLRFKIAGSRMRAWQLDIPSWQDVLRNCSSDLFHHKTMTEHCYGAGNS